MPVPLIGTAWGVTMVMAALVMLALVVLASIVMHARKIAESEKRFQHLFNRVFDVLILIDDKGKIVDVNESARKLLGYSKKDLLKSKFEDFIPEDERRKLRAEFVKIYNDGTDYIGETGLVCKDSEDLIKVEVGGTRIKMEDDVYILGSFRDITERWRAEESLKRKNIALKEVLTYLEEERFKIRKDVADTVDRILLPALNKLIQPDGKISETYYKSLLSNLQELSATAGAALESYSKLTPREIEICNLIKSGATSKEIAKTLNISPATIKKHRLRIRTKLNIANKDINLISHLKNLE